MKHSQTKNQQHLSLFRFINSIVWPFRWYVIIQMIVHIIWAIDVSLTSYLIKLMIDAAHCQYSNEIVYRVGPYALLFVIKLIVITCLYRLYDWVCLISNPRIEQRATIDLMNRLLQQSHQFFQDQMAGGLANSVRLVADRIPDLIDLFGEKLFGHILAIVIAAWTFWMVSSLLALTLIVWFVLFVAIAFFCLPYLNKLSDISSEKASKIVGQSVDTFTNMMSVRLFAGQEFELQHMEHLTEERVKAERTRGWFFLKMHAIQAIIFILFMGTNLWLLVNGLVNKSVTVGDFALVLASCGQIINFMWSISHDLVKFTQKLGSVTQGLRVAMTPVTVVNIPSAPQLKVGQGEIIFKQVSFRYHGKHDFFENLSVTIEPGQKVGLVGYSGGGKSTFVNLILRLFDVDLGTIYIDGQNIARVSQNSLRQSIGFIPQDPTLFHRTLYENILYARPDASERDIVLAAQRAHAHEFIITCSKGYQTEVGERGIKLSGGQRQRIAIARAILKNAPILIMDEATSQLDSITEQYIQDSLDTLMKGKTTLVIAHRLSTLLDMDRILVFDQGAIVEDGTHEELLHNDGLYKILWEQQVGGFLLDEKYNDYEPEKNGEYSV